MQFEWDDNKAQGNVRKHGVTFDEALSAFYDVRGQTVRIISARRATRKEAEDYARGL